MTFIRPRNSPVRLLGKRLMILVLIILVVAATWSVWSAYQKERESAVLRSEAEAELKDFSLREEHLTSGIADLESDRGKEAVLREQYALAARGEGLIVIVDPPKPAPIEATTTILERIKRAFIWW